MNTLEVFLSSLPFFLTDMYWEWLCRTAHITHKIMSRQHFTLNEKMQLIPGYNRDLALQDVSIGDHRITAIVFIDVDSERPTVKEWFGIHETIVTCHVNEEMMLFSVELKMHQQNTWNDAKVRLFSTREQRQSYHLICELQSKLIDLYLHRKKWRQTNIDHFSEMN